jgi:hypothetical protein
VNECPRNGMSRIDRERPRTVKVRGLSLYRSYVAIARPRIGFTVKGRFRGCPSKPLYCPHEDGEYAVVNTTTFLRWFGLSRVAFGLWLTLAPAKPGEIWFGSKEHAAPTTIALRGLGARDVSLGVGLASDPRPQSTWVRVGIFADVVDAISAILMRDRLPERRFLVGVIGGSLYAVIGAIVALRSSYSGR